MTAQRPVPPLGRQIGVATVLLVAVVAVSFVGSLAAIGNTDGWYADVRKVPWSPPDAVFAPVWSVLYLCIALAAFLVWRFAYAGPSTRSRARTWLVVYGVQLLLNAAWTPTFFAGYPVVAEAAWWAAAVIILLLIATVGWLMVAAWRFSRAAAVLLAPYLLWIAFASTLNIGIIVLN